ncbi:MAG: enoyl-CoA hydratase/isomerase family protein [Pseudomonadota bacterium]
MSDYQAIKYECDQGIATITLNMPDTLNAITLQMRTELMSVLASIEADDAVRVVVITGSGRGFCAGADLTEGLGEHPTFVEQCEAEYKPWLMQIHNSKKLFIAAVNGPCAGIGCALTLNCDMVVMDEQSYLYQAFAAIGMMPDGGVTWLFLRQLGYQKAMELITTAGKLSAEECFNYGMANYVTEPGQALEKAMSLAHKVAAGAPLAQTATKEVLRAASGLSYAETIDVEAVKQSALVQSEDSLNAVQAFLKKEKPVFKGR